MGQQLIPMNWRMWLVSGAKWLLGYLKALYPKKRKESFPKMQWDPYCAIPLMDKNPSITTWDVQKILRTSKDYQAETWFPGFCPLAGYSMSICISKKSVCFCGNSNHPEQVQSSSAIPRMLNIWPQIPRFSGCAGCSRFNGQSGKDKDHQNSTKTVVAAGWDPVDYYNDNNSIVCKSYTDSYMKPYDQICILHGWSIATESLNAMTSRSEWQFHTGEASQDIFTQAKNPTILSPVVEASRWRPVKAAELLGYLKVLNGEWRIYQKIPKHMVRFRNCGVAIACSHEFHTQVGLLTALRMANPSGKPV